MEVSFVSSNFPGVARCSQVASKVGCLSCPLSDPPHFSLALLSCWTLPLWTTLDKLFILNLQNICLDSHELYLNFFLHNTTMVKFHSVNNFCFSYHGLSYKWYTSAAGSHFWVYTPNNSFDWNDWRSILLHSILVSWIKSWGWKLTDYYSFHSDRTAN